MLEQANLQVYSMHGRYVLCLPLLTHVSKHACVVPFITLLHVSQAGCMEAVCVPAKIIAILETTVWPFACAAVSKHTGGIVV